MADVLVTQLARALHLPPDAAQQTLHRLVSTLREQIEATGEAAVPGLGVFREADGRLAFEPDDALVRAVNHRFAGLTPVGAAPAPDRSPSADTPTEFKPLPSFVGDEPEEVAEPGGAEEPSEETEQTAPDDEATPPAALPDEPPHIVPEPADDATHPDPEKLAEEDDPGSGPGQAVTEDEVPLVPEAPQEPDDEEEVGDEASEERQPTGPEANLTETEDEDSDLDRLLAGTWTEETGEEENERHPLGPMPEEAVEEAEYSLVEPDAEHDAEHEEERTDDDDAGITPLPTPPAEAEPTTVEHEGETEPVAPVVAATAAAAGRTPKSKRERPNRGPLIAGILVGALLALAFLLWLRSREPAPPPVAERPPVADTVAATVPPADTTAAALPADTAAAPAEPPAPPDPLRGDAPITPADGGFTWVVASELNRVAAERRVARYREQSLRAGVVAEEAGGRTRYRVSLGQFDTIEEAEARRSDLPADVPPDSWILRL